MVGEQLTTDMTSALAEIIKANLKQTLSVILFILSGRNFSSLIMDARIIFSTESDAETKT